MSDLNLYSVNWQDGMLVTQQHLKDQERYFEELARWYALDVGDSYGLVRKGLSGQPALVLNLSLSGNRLRVEVVRCQAITPDGSVIEINESNQSSVRAEVPATSPVVPVFVGIQSAARKQVGQPDPHEDLPRIPFLVGNYVVSLGQPPNLPQGRYLQAAELAVSGSEVGHADGYFPPCLSLNADERLARKAADYRNRLENLLSLSSRAYAALAAGGALAGEQTQLQTAFQETIYQFACHLASAFDEFIIGRNARHPMYLVLFFKRLLRVFSTLVNLRPGLKDLLNERFFVKEMNSDVGRFMSAVDAFLLAEYNHANIGGDLRTIDELVGTLRGILGFLAQLKREQLGEQAVATDTLTYHGRTYRVVDYSQRTLQQVGELSYLLIDMADPRAMSDTVVLLTKDIFSAADWSRMQIRQGLNDARGLGETDPVDVDVVTFGNKVALRPQDMLRSPSVRKLTLIFRGAPDPQKFASLGKMDLIVYSL
ncbi:MAG TPA: hypothetical protein VN285_06895 [Candidatus Deferrimicrobium sp.]|nr:hypothetical protein [Candidatus Deferrimicrobium sp.]